MEDRRKFIKGSLSVAACCCIGGLSILSGCSNVIYLSGKEEGNTLTINKIDFADQQYVVVNTTKLPSPVYLKKNSEEKYKAYLMHCTHKGCTVKPAGNIMVCPCHGAEFSSEGKVLNGPAQDNLMEYVVTTKGDVISIQISKT